MIASSTFNLGGANVMNRESLQENLRKAIKEFWDALVDFGLIVTTALFKLFTFILKMLPLLLRYLAVGVFLVGTLYCATAGGLNPVEMMSWALFSVVLAVSMVMLIEEWDVSWRMIGAGIVCGVVGWIIRITSPVVQGIAITSLFGMLLFQFITEENQNDLQFTENGTTGAVSDAQEQGAESVRALSDVRDGAGPAHHDDLPHDPPRL